MCHIGIFILLKKVYLLLSPSILLEIALIIGKLSSSHKWIHIFGSCNFDLEALISPLSKNIISIFFFQIKMTAFFVHFHENSFQIPKCELP